MKKALLFGLCLVFSFPAFSQVSEMMGFRDFRDVADAYYVKFQNNSKFDLSDIQGSPFLNEEFAFGNILENKSMKKVETNLRYDMYKDLFEIQLESGSETINTLDRTKNIDYYLNGEKFVLIQSRIININHYDSGNGYVVELIPENDNAALYKRYYVDIKPGSKANTSYEVEIPPSIKKKVMYIVKIENDYYELPANKKEIVEVFLDNQNDLKSYIKEKKFKFKGDEKEVQDQMVQLVRYYNSLD